MAILICARHTGRARGRDIGCDLVLAQLTGARYHVAHISTRNAVAMVEYARQNGLLVTCETTPHHFALTDDDMAPYDSNYKIPCEKPTGESAADQATEAC